LSEITPVNLAKNHVATLLENLACVRKSKKSYTKVHLSRLVQFYRVAQKVINQ